MMAGYHVVISAPSIGRRERINDRPTTLLNARRVLWSFAARLERTPEVRDIAPDLWLSDAGELCEGLRWRIAECDGVEGCQFTAHISGSEDDSELDNGDRSWTRD